MKKIRFFNNQTGDTIIEVMISVVIVGLALGISYGTAARSLKGLRQSQERSEALKRVEGQIERLKAKVHSNDPRLFDSTKVYCLADSGGQNQIVLISGLLPLPSLTDDPLSAYTGACTDGLYHLAIVPGGAASGDQFTIVARWFGINGNAKEEVKMYYRIHEPS